MCLVKYQHWLIIKLFGNPDLIATDLKRYASVTKADVMRVFEQYIKGKPHVVMSVVPMGQKQLIAHADNYTPLKSGSVNLRQWP